MRLRVAKGRDAAGEGCAEGQFCDGGDPQPGPGMTIPKLQFPSQPLS